MISFLICLVFLLLILLVFFGYKAYTFSILILKLEDNIEESLEILEERYESMSKILEKDVFFDSIEVRQVIDDIRISHEAIFIIANSLTQNFLEKNEIKEKNNKDSKKEN